MCGLQLLAPTAAVVNAAVVLKVMLIPCVVFCGFGCGRCTQGCVDSVLF